MSIKNLKVGDKIEVFDGYKEIWRTATIKSFSINAELDNTTYDKSKLVKIHCDDINDDKIATINTHLIKRYTLTSPCHASEFHCIYSRDAKQNGYILWISHFLTSGYVTSFSPNLQHIEYVIPSRYYGFDIESSDIIHDGINNKLFIHQFGEQPTYHKIYTYYAQTHQFDICDMETIQFQFTQFHWKNMVRLIFKNFVNRNGDCLMLLMAFLAVIISILFYYMSILIATVAFTGIIIVIALCIQKHVLLGIDGWDSFTKSSGTKMLFIPDLDEIHLLSFTHKFGVLHMKYKTHDAENIFELKGIAPKKYQKQRYAQTCHLLYVERLNWIVLVDWSDYEIFCYDLNDTDNDQWKYDNHKWNFGRLSNFTQNLFTLLIFDTIIVFITRSGRILCLDLLLTKKLYVSHKQFEIVWDEDYIKDVKALSTWNNFIHFISNDDHFRIDAAEIIPKELSQIYQDHYRNLIVGYFRWHTNNVENCPIDLQNMILIYYTRLVCYDIDVIIKNAKRSQQRQ